MKRTIAILLLCLTALSLCACGGKTEAKTADPGALAQALLSAGVFSDKMSEPADGVAARLYSIGEGDAAEVVLYTGSGATAEELFIARANGTEAAAALKAACETRVSNQKLVFASYAPEEVEKLDNAVLVTAGELVVLVVSADADAAGKLVRENIS